LSFWVARASTDLSQEECDKTVAALVSGLASDDNAVRVVAADALAVLGPRAKSAAKPLIAQLGDEQPFVRAACSGALVSMGKEAVPVLIHTFQTETGGIRVRSAFALGAIGPAAKDAVPILEAAMEKENEVMRTRFIGILGNIAPEKYGPVAGRRPSSMPPKRGGRFNRPRAPIGLNSAARRAMLSLARRVC
jgi:HEAT repeat protein